MKARTHVYDEGNPCRNHLEIFFTYEDYGGEHYDTYDDAKKGGWEPIYLVGYLFSHYYNSGEPIDELYLSRRPTYSEVKAFMEQCKEVILKD